MKSLSELPQGLKCLGNLKGPWWPGSVTQQYFASMATRGLHRSIPHEQQRALDPQESDACKERQPVTLTRA